MPNEFIDDSMKFQTKELCAERYEKLCLQIAFQDRLNAERFAKQKEDLLLARELLHARLDGMNEIRKQLNDQAKTFASKIAIDLEMEHMRQTIHPLLVKANKDEGALSIKAVVISVVASLFVAWAVHALLKL